MYKVYGKSTNVQESERYKLFKFEHFKLIDFIYDNYHCLLTENGLSHINAHIYKGIHIKKFQWRTYKDVFKYLYIMYGEGIKKFEVERLNIFYDLEATTYFHILEIRYKGDK